MAYDMDDQAECPLCMEQFEMDDLSFFPCTCGYQICRFCWHRIRTDENGLCPACRKPYSENPADFKPLTNEELQKIKAEKKQKDLQKKLKMSENKKHLANVRVVQKNLVFVVGLSPRLSDPEVLKRHEYFGKFGKIHKVVINHSTQYVGGQCRNVQAQGPSASAYVTYYRSDDALRAIAAVNNVTIENRTLKASLGTTKYCSHFMKNQACPKTDCMYLHEPGDEAASFTKEAMQQGKHTEYEKKLHDQVFQQSQNQINRVKDRRSNPSQSESGSVPIPSGSQRLGSAGNSPPGGSAGSSGGGGSSGGANGSWPLFQQQPAKKSRGRKNRKRNAESATTARTAGVTPLVGAGAGGGAVPVVNNQSDDETSTGSRDRQTDSSRSTPLSQSAGPVAAATPPPEPVARPSVTPPPPAPTPPSAAATPPAPPAAAAGPEPVVERPASPPPSVAPSPVPSPAPVVPTPAPAPVPAAAPTPAIATLTPPPGLSPPTPATTPASSSGSAEWLLPGRGDSLIPGRGDSLIPGRSDSLIPGRGDSLIPNRSDSLIPGRGDSLISNRSDPLIPGRGDSLIPGRGDSLAAALLSQPTPPPEADELDNAADDLDFDPFEETEKGLSALLEREREQQARQAAAQRQQALRLTAGGVLPPAPGLTSFNAAAAAPRARLPPPGFSGPSALGLGPLGHPPQQQPTPDLCGSKMLPFLNGGGGLNGLNGLSRPPPGRPRPLSPPNTLFSDLSSLMMAGQGQPPPPPQPQPQPPRHDSLKDWHGLKKHFPHINISVSPQAPAGPGRFPPGQPGVGPARLPPAHHGPPTQMARFMAQPPKPTGSTGWSAGSDWTAMDPAIVSSGQLAGPPRSDSPPHWLRSLEQLTETGPMYPPQRRAAPAAAPAPALWTATPPPGFNPTL